MLRKISETIRENLLFCQGDTVVVAVSGGADSVALLDILTSMRKLSLNLVVAHLNHGLRDKESDDDAAFVRELSARYRLPFELQRVDVKEVSKERKLSLEEAGRKARYEWFDMVARSCSARSIALGHHADDQAETFLLRLFRGSGITGLASMRLLSSGRYVRPLLMQTRDEILAYLERRGLSYRHDRSNDETVFLRNRIRHECLPYLRTFNPAISERLNNAAEILAADETVLETLIDQRFPRLSRSDSDGVVLDLKAVRAELPGLRFRFYRRALLLLRGDLARIATTHLKKIDQLVHSSRTQGQQSLPGGFTVMRCYDTLHFLPAGKESGSESWEIRIEGPGRYALPDGGTISVRLTEPPVNWGSVPLSRAYFDPAIVPFPWTLRTFQPGDRFRPFGMGGTRKIKDFFIDRKIPLFLRRRIPLLFSGEELIWVCGLRVSESGRAQLGTQEVAEVEIPDFTQYSACKTAGRMVFHH
ncbi:MAG: tRNA lysidine(34) synthetase TilS [Geobacteraceae bacterium]|nr:tRNA lysidine(34) synthetase TilS [Geobacteraceae bacterium]